MLSISPLGVGLLAIAASLFIVRRRRRLAYPPGPKGYPLVGNVFDVSQSVPLWTAAMAMGEKYSKRVDLAACLHSWAECWCHQILILSTSTSSAPIISYSIPTKPSRTCSTNARQSILIGCVYSILLFSALQLRNSTATSSHARAVSRDRFAFVKPGFHGLYQDWRIFLVPPALKIRGSVEVQSQAPP